MATPFHAAIYYFLVVPDWRPEQATPLAGFSLSLCENTGLVRRVGFLPASVLDLDPENHAGLIARKVCGTAPIHFFPQSPRAILSQALPLETPFVLVILGADQNPDDYREWARSCPTPPTIVAKSGGDLGWDELSREGLQRRLLDVCEQMSPDLDPDGVAQVKSHIAAWSPLPSKKLDYEVGGHATVSANVMALMAAGYDNPVTGPFKLLGEGIQPYVDQIVRTTRSVLAERAVSEPSIMEPSFPRTPDLTVFAPSLFAAVDRLKAPAAASNEAQRDFQVAINALDRQPGYSFEARTEAQFRAIFGATPEELKVKDGPISPHPLMRIRQLELALSTQVTELLAASEVSAVLRMPNAVNRTSGAVRQFAAHYRGNSRSGQRSLDAFRQVQKRIAEAVPAEFIDLIEEAGDDIRIVSDAHLEWLNVGGLPLCLRKNLSRIPVTPGNLFVEVMSAKDVIRLTEAERKDILVLSALKPEDEIRGMFEVAFDTFGRHWRDKLDITFKEVGNADDLVNALNEFDGAIVIFDGHGGHAPGKPAVLKLKDQDCDVWSLKGRVTRPPPIMILSACDTHAADRNHATTANGFLALGVRAVLGSVFPLEAMSAAAFAARLVYRVADYIPPATGILGRALTWSEICGGMLRMQVLTDFRNELERKRLVTEEQSMEIGYAGNRSINMGGPYPFDAIVKSVAEFGVDEGTAKRELRMAIARSSAISYLNIGRPETILFDTTKRLEGAAAEIAAAMEDT